MPKNWLPRQNMNMKNLVPLRIGFHFRYQKSKIPKERGVFIVSGFLLPVFFLYIMQMLNIHRYSTKDETIVALLLIKDFIIERGGIEEIKVIEELLRSSERARERYGAFLEQQKKVEEQMKLAKMKEELGKQTKDDVLEVENKMQFPKKGIEVAETGFEEGNHELGEAMKGKTLNQDKIVLCQSKITMGLERKTELSNRLSKFEEKKMKLCTK